jgi:DNA-binding protein YbaB
MPATLTSKTFFAIRFLLPTFTNYNTLRLIFSAQRFTVNMGQAKKEGNRKVREGKVGDGMANVKVKGENFYRYE